MFTVKYFLSLACSYHIYNTASNDYSCNNSNRIQYSGNNDDWCANHIRTNSNYHWTNDHIGNYNTKYAIQVKIKIVNTRNNNTCTRKFLNNVDLFIALNLQHKLLVFLLLHKLFSQISIKVYFMYVWLHFTTLQIQQRLIYLPHWNQQQLPLNQRRHWNYTITNTDHYIKWNIDLR